MRLSQVLPDEEELRAALETGFAFCALGRLPEAEDVFRGVAELFPAADVPWVGLSQVYLRRGQYAEAQAACEEALRRQPASCYARVHRAEAVLWQQRRAEAEQELHEAIALAPDSPHSHTARALLATAELICGNNDAS